MSCHQLCVYLLSALSLSWRICYVVHCPVLTVFVCGLLCLCLVWCSWWYISQGAFRSECRAIDCSCHWPFLWFRPPVLLWRRRWWVIIHRIIDFIIRLVALADTCGIGGNTRQLSFVRTWPRRKRTLNWGWAQQLCLHFMVSTVPA